MDGSIESTLRARGHHEHPVELYNLKNPFLIEKLHREFLEAGAEIIQSNTAGANALTLATHGLHDKVYEINRKGVWQARQAAVGRAYVAGVVGPVGKFLTPIGKLHHEDVRESAMAQLHALLDGGCDLLLLKSFIEIEELEIVLEAARHISPDIPIIAHKTFPEDAAVLATDFPRQIAARIARHGVAAIGSNGTVGPNRMLTIARSLAGLDQLQPGLNLSAQPDIGIPTLVDGQPVYNATIDYVANSVKALVANGVTVVGADGGALPEHIRAIRQAIDGMEVGKPEVKTKKRKEPAEQHDTTTQQGSRFQQSLGRKFLVTVELDVPRGVEMDHLFESAAYLHQHGIDAVNISDGARARLRMSPITISHLITQRTGMECITHLSCRDRNMVGLQSELLGAHALGLRNILAVTGDPTHIGDYPYATSVYDVDSVGLIRTLSRMNNGEDLMGNPVGNGGTNFMVACAVNPMAFDINREIARLERKVAEGAHVAFTQPIFEASTVRQFLSQTEHLNIPIMIGVMPLRSALHAEFLHHELPGMFIPEAIQQRMRGAAQPLEEGVEITVEFLQSIADLRQRIAGMYIMPPGKRFDMIVEILRRMWEEVQ